MIATITVDGPTLGVRALCEALPFPRATYYRHRHPRYGPSPRRTRPARALALVEQQQVLARLHERRFADLAPGQVYAQLLDEGTYLCSERTMYRLLAEVGEVRERRDHCRHPHYAAPELLATGPNQLWSWDITKLRGPAKWTSFYLYVLLDVFSRYVVGWLLAHRESATLAQRLIATTVAREGIVPGQLTVHADRGAAMISKPVAFLLADLGITKTHSRPHVANDNPFSEAQFKTLKYHPSFPDRFGSFEHGRAHCADFFPWYNTEHRHSSLGWHTPHDVHRGHAAARQAHRAAVLATAYAATPARFVRHAPTPPAVPTAVWINEPRIGPTAEIRPEASPTDGHNRPKIDDRQAIGDRSTPRFGVLPLVQAVTVNAGEWCPEDDDSVNSVPLVSHTP
jgi:putative transposase